uniref:AIG1-type G domain-containing protein n=1 Tax=Cyprinus carpio carpio TaxID=630221 RepID=A0A8C1DN88_CYPCA
LGCCYVSKPERKIVLLGKTGDGKSTAGNTILREKMFIPKVSANSVTAHCERRQRKVHGRKITVIDTPGFFDMDHNDAETKSEIVKSLIECAPVVDAFIIVLKVGRHDNEVVQKFLNTLHKDALKHAVILFTFGEQLEGKTIKEFVKDSSQLQELVDKCGGRCHVIDNKYWKKRIWGNKSNRVQVKNLLKTIDKMVEENGCCTNEFLQKLEKHIQEDEKNISAVNLSPEEIREKAKEMVHEEYVKRLAGVATGTLMGAFLGIDVVVRSVVTLLTPENPQAVIQIVRAAAQNMTQECEIGSYLRAGITAAGGALCLAGAVGAVVGGVTGYKAAEEADSVNDSVTRAVADTYAKALHVNEKVQDLVSVASKDIKAN